MNEVWITSIGILTPHGRGLAKNTSEFQLGTSTFAPLPSLHSSGMRVTSGCEISELDPLPDYLTEKNLDRAGHILSLSLLDAIKNVKIPANTPLFLGTLSHALNELQRVTLPEMRTPTAMQRFDHRYNIDRHIEACEVICKATLEPMVLSNACSSGVNAIGMGFHSIRHGLAEMALCGGYEAHARSVFAGFNALRSLSNQAPRPFDINRDGLALGEGSAILVLEQAESARKRGATPIAKIQGYATISDHHHITKPQPDGLAVEKVMQLALADAGLTAEDIDYLNVHGTGTPLNDKAEAEGIRQCFGQHVTQLPVSSLKSSVGHLLGAAGAVETAVCAMALKGSWLPPTITTNNLDIDCLFPLVTKPTLKYKLNNIMTNSFGFGGASASLILSQP